MEKKNLYIALAVLGVGIVLLGGIFFFMMRGSSQTAQNTKTPGSSAQTGAVPTLTPQDLGLTITPSRNGQALMVNVTKISDVSLIEYELDYTAKTAQGVDVPRGVIGKIQIASGQTKAQQEIVLGTCSDVCHYDKDVTGIQLTLKVTKTDGTVYSLITTSSVQ